MQSINLFLPLFSLPLPDSKALQCNTHPYRKAKLLVCRWCGQVSWVCEQLLFALPRAS